MTPSTSRLGWACLLLILLLLAVAIPLRCIERAALVGGGALLAGGTLGFAMAMITRTRRPLLIYFWLGIVVLSFWPLYAGWPPGEIWELHPWPNAPDLVYNYFDMLRGGLFLLAFPWVFARLGYHAPDPLPASSESNSALCAESQAESRAEIEETQET